MYRYKLLSKPSKIKLKAKEQGESCTGWKCEGGDKVSKKVGDILTDCMQFDDQHGIVNPPTQDNLNYLGLCIAGEAGEFANVVKKIIRGGGNQGATKSELIQRAMSELVDIGIYFCEGVDLFEKMGYSFDAEWNKKFEELYNRPFWENKREALRSGQ